MRSSTTFTFLFGIVVSASVHVRCALAGNTNLRVENILGVSRLHHNEGIDLFEPPVFERSVRMQGSGCQNVQWTVDMEALTITFHVESSAGADWVGLGLSENGGMKGADIAIVRKSSSGSELVVDDRVSVGYIRPEKDTLQNIELLYSEIRESDERIVAVIRRDLDTCDIDDLSVVPNKQNLICASGMTSSEGEILYHGPNVAKALVNLMVDEELLLESNLSEGNKSFALGPMVTVRGDIEESFEPFPVDIQMPNINLTADVVTSYVCSEVDLPFDLRRIRDEVVWEEGITMDTGFMPPYFHHLGLYYCPDSYFEELERSNGQPYDCFDMPSCTLEASLGRGSTVTLPAGIHARTNAGRYVLQLHYENNLGVPVNNDRSGIRVWVEPPRVPSRTRPASVFSLDGNLNSIHIPADPKQEDYSIQFMIPGEATREHVPPEGVQAFASAYHMHNAGLNARLQLIRDGVHILDVFNSLSYDFHLQTPTYKLWKLLPGDSLLMTCTYRPHPERDIYGGLASEDEMCVSVIGFVTPQNSTWDQILGVGYPVEKGQPLNKAFLGTIPDGEDRHTLDSSFATFSPSFEEENFVPIKNHRYNTCEVAVRDSLQLPVYTFAEYNITAMITLIVTFCFCSFLAAKPVWKRIIAAPCDERLKRNTIIYFGQLIYGTFAMIICFIAGMELYNGEDTFGAVDPTTYLWLRGTIVVQILLYLVELFYRIDVRLEVVLHHVLVAISVIFISWAGSDTFAVKYILEVALPLFLMAVTDHPMNLALLLKNLGYAKTKWWPKLCKISGVLFILAKVIPFAFSISIMIRPMNGDGGSLEISNHSFSEWLVNEDKIELRDINIFLPILFSLLFLVQLYIGYVLWVLSSRYERQNRERAELKMEHDGTENQSSECEMGKPIDGIDTSRLPETTRSTAILG